MMTVWRLCAAWPHVHGLCVDSCCLAGSGLQSFNGFGFWVRDVDLGFNNRCPTRAYVCVLLGGYPHADAGTLKPPGHQLHASGGFMNSNGSE